MADQIEYLSGARKDFDEAFAWYAERSTFAALGFIAAVDEAIAKVLQDPARFPATMAGCKYCSLRKYPFRLVFCVENGRTIIVAISHAKRLPGYWQNRT